MDKLTFLGACLVALSVCATAVVILRLARKPSFNISIRGLGVEILVTGSEGNNR